ncbi:matrix metalloproteinase-9-like [Tubulanus polymorphus]|uniref:matrix metalloproteinase-9-like n=1 Tax=Tubulanus polymorphus TaxID=672921 RepID=UPI003DA5BC85
MKRLVITTLLIVEVVSSGRIDENIAGQTEIASCVFPFTYGGKQYTECTVTDATEPWCSTTSNYNVDKRWRFCADWMRVEYGGNTGGEPCQFPFLFAGVNISTCITSYSDIPWCSTTANYDQEKTWSFCRSIKKSDLADCKL